MIVGVVAVVIVQDPDSIEAAVVDDVVKVVQAQVGAVGFEDKAGFTVIHWIQPAVHCLADY